jgi:hypothetical protein
MQMCVHPGIGETALRGTSGAKRIQYMTSDHTTGFEFLRVQLSNFKSLTLEIRLIAWLQIMPAGINKSAEATLLSTESSDKLRSENGSTLQRAGPDHLRVIRIPKPVGTPGRPVSKSRRGLGRVARRVSSDRVNRKQKFISENYYVRKY